MQILQNSQIGNGIFSSNGEKNEKKYGVLTPDLANLHSELQHHDVTEVGMESTSIYWQRYYFSRRIDHGQR